MQRPSKIGSFINIKGLKPDASCLVPVSFVLLLIFKLISLLITNKTVENLLIIPFQLIIFALPAVLYMGYRSEEDGAPPLKGMRIRPPRLYQLPLLASAWMLMICGNVLVSLIFSGTGSLENGFTLYNTFVSRNSGGFFTTLYLILAYAVVPAFCEELVFRSLLCREYEKHNVLLGMIVSSVFFAMLHFDLPLFPVYLFSGMILALTMYATGSVIASMAVHMAFNVTGLFGQPFLSAFYNITSGTGGLFVFILCMLTLLSAALFCTFAAKSYSIRAKRSNMPPIKILPPADRLTQTVSKLLITPFSIAAFFIYIVAVILGAFL